MYTRCVTMIETSIQLLLLHLCDYADKKVIMGNMNIKPIMTLK